MSEIEQRLDKIGNVASFVNHSCDRGNLTTKLFRNSGALFPCLCFFILVLMRWGWTLYPGVDIVVY
jgi:hypothetical protein